MKPILITLGDPAGIGPEITQKAIKELGNHPGIILFGHPTTIDEDYPIYTGAIKPNEIKLIPTESNQDPDTNSFNNPLNAQIAYDSIINALEFSKQNKTTGLVTAPISKEGFFKAKIPTTDHTTLLKSFFKCKASMAFYSEKLKVVLTTIHIAISEVEKQLTFESVENAVDNAILFSKNVGIDNPKIGIAGLNPHAGENGQFGRFECDYLIPWIKKLNKGHLRGPISPDIIFKHALEGKYDIVIAMYHDQGLIPLKLIAFESAVNVTIGLPICRTSPDHGTAYDIAGKNIANHNAMKSAIEYVLKFGK